MAGSDFFRRSNGTNNSGAIETVSGSEIMFAITYDSVAGMIKLYRNGALYAQYAQTTNLQTYDALARLVIGPRVGTAGYFNGSINEARIYDTPLTATQIANIFSSFYSPLDIDMPFWDLEVNHTTTLELESMGGTVVLGDLVINLGDHSPPDTILEILSNALSISWDGLVINGPAAAGTYVLVDWSDMPGTSDPFFDGMFSSVTFNGVAGSLTYFDDQIVFEAQAAAVPEPSTWALAVLGLVALGWVARRRRA
jgi:hypothetical protein